jgi:hypothetical protein
MSREHALLYISIYIYIKIMLYAYKMPSSSDLTVLLSTPPSLPPPPIETHYAMPWRGERWEGRGGTDLGEREAQVGGDVVGQNEREVVSDEAQYLQHHGPPLLVGIRRRLAAIYPVDQREQLHDIPGVSDAATICIVGH